VFACLCLIGVYEGALLVAVADDDKDIFEDLLDVATDPALTLFYMLGDALLEFGIILPDDVSWVAEKEYILPFLQYEMAYAILNDLQQNDPE
jgi:hypothetical protein